MARVMDDKLLDLQQSLSSIRILYRKPDDRILGGNFSRRRLAVFAAHPCEITPPCLTAFPISTLASARRSHRTTLPRPQTWASDTFADPVECRACRMMSCSISCGPIWRCSTQIRTASCKSPSELPTHFGGGTQHFCPVGQSAWTMPNMTSAARSNRPTMVLIVTRKDVKTGNRRTQTQPQTFSQ